MASKKQLAARKKFAAAARSGKGKIGKHTARAKAKARKK
jgi:hypothetical protein